MGYGGGKKGGGGGMIEPQPLTLNVAVLESVFPQGSLTVNVKISERSRFMGWVIVTTCVAGSMLTMSMLFPATLKVN